LQQSFGKEPSSFGNLLDSLYKTGWVVYSKPPFAGPKAVLKYLGRYTHRIAISNSRIEELTDEAVSFKWKDYADNNRQKVMRLSQVEFIRRFLLHVLPTGFVIPFLKRRVFSVFHTVVIIGRFRENTVLRFSGAGSEKRETAMVQGASGRTAAGAGRSCS
jgi:hypothetical protein